MSIASESSDTVLTTSFAKSKQSQASTQVIKRFTKRNGVLTDEEVLESCLFVPVISGIER